MQWSRIKPFYINFPCCGYHDCDDVYSVQSYEPEHANVLIISGVITKSVWPMVQEVYQRMQKPSALIRLGFAGKNLYDEKFVPDLGVVANVTLYGCPVTRAKIDEAFRRLRMYG